MVQVVVFPVNRATGRVNTSYPSSLILNWVQQDGLMEKLKTSQDTDTGTGDDTTDQDVFEIACVYDETGNASIRKDMIPQNSKYIVCELDSCHAEADGAHLYTLIDSHHDDITEIVFPSHIQHRSWLIIQRFQDVIDGSANADYAYLSLLKDLTALATNPVIERYNRTEITTISTFAKQIRIDISHGKFPLLTTKRIPFKHAAEELLWFCRGETDSKVLEKANVKIWKANSSREFLDNHGLHRYEEGDIGPGYGFQWRKFGASYMGALPGKGNLYKDDNQGFDQLAYIECLLKTDPMSRRIVLSAWAPDKIHEMALPPCHVMAQWYVSNSKSGANELSCMLTMRSCDTFLGLPWNIASYALLTYILATRCNMVPKELVINMGDCHLYTNCIEQARLQLTRDVGICPRISIDDSVRVKSWEDIQVTDFKIHGYYPMPSIKASMAV